QIFHYVRSQVFDHIIDLTDTGDCHRLDAKRLNYLASLLNELFHERDHLLMQTIDSFYIATEQFAVQTILRKNQIPTGLRNIIRIRRKTTHKRYNYLSEI